MLGGLQRVTLAADDIERKDRTSVVLACISARSRRKRLGSPYISGRSRQWIKMKNPAAPAVKREAEEDWGGMTP
jgi:hypothetical protein